jgi:hypothetical protein
LNWPWRYPGVIKRLCGTSRACSATTGRATYLATWPDGWRVRKLIVPVVPHSICYLTGDARIAERAQTQGKIECWHQTMMIRVLLENYYLPGDLERQIGAFVNYYNNERYRPKIPDLLHLVRRPQSQPNVHVHS